MRLYIGMSALILLTGCTSFKQDIGDYVKDAVVQSVEKKLDEKLGARGLSIAEITSILDTNRDGHVTKGEAIVAAKEIARDVALAEAKKLVDEEVAEAKKDNDGKHKSIWNYFIGLVGTGLSALIAKHMTDRSKFKKLEDAIMGDDEPEAPPKAKKPPEPPQVLNG